MDLKQRNTRFLFPVFVFIFILVFLLERWNYFSFPKSYNLMVKATIGNRIASDNVVLVVIDDDSLFKIGRWPWKREYYLQIFDYIENYTNAKLMAYDGLITMPDKDFPESDRKFFSQIKNFKKLTAGVSFSNNSFKEYINEKEYDNLLKTKTDIKIIDKRSEKYKIASPFKSFTIFQPQYFKNVPSLGFVDVGLDLDDYARAAYQLINYKGNFFPSLGLSLYSKYTGVKEFILTDKYLLGFSDKHTLKIPLEYNKGFIGNYICFYNYYKGNKDSDNIENKNAVDKDFSYTHKKYSASDIINAYQAIKKGKKPKLDSTLFDNKVVIVGANAQAKALEDYLRTPVSEIFPGVDIQATNFDNLITNNFYTTVSDLYNLLICILMYVLVFWLVSSMPTVLSLASGLCLAFLYYGFAYFMYRNKIAVDLFLPEFFILIGLLCAYSYKYLVEDTKKNKIQKAMGKYLSYDVMRNVVQNIDNIALGGKRADITVLFADIRNFTSISENMDAASTSMILNEYFSELVPIIESHNGVLNKFMGDAILAIFGEPKKNENHALDAVKCGYKMLKKVKFLQEKWIDEGKPKIEIGIGISSGDAFVGNIGSQNRLEYTVIGDTVNTASRIENYNKVYRTNFLISEETYKRVKKYVDVITINDVTIRGKANKINLYEVIRLISE